ncbi:MAG: aldehyde dehydrogenase [Pirellulales bacterium]|nr:aldehyde dehydrogenase [Pirellulales bacterium]
MKHINNFIAGEMVPAQSGAYLANIEPATGTAYSEVADSDAADVGTAVNAARAAFPAWSQTTAAVRSRRLLSIAQGIENRLEEFARAESIDTGKPISLARNLDIPRAIQNFRFFATAILHTQSAAHVTDGAALNYTLRHPVGVAGLITPWNLPLYLLSWKIAPALATGNTAIAKPSELTPMTAGLLAEVCQETELPPGVLNIVHGTGAKVGTAITAHPQVACISFTGGTVTGKRVAQSAAPHFKKVSLELGGKNPTIVFKSADLASAVPGAARAAFANQGQVCLCGSRIFVQASIYEEFTERLVASVQKIRIGDPLDESTQHGALVSHAQFEKTMSYVQLAKDEGGELLYGGQPCPTINDRCQNGFFFPPTLITGLPADCRVNQEEIFGPIATLTPFSNEAEVVDAANGTPYGLSASVWTQDLGQAQRVSAGLECGTVWVNCWLTRDLRVPFGGVKASGVGREGGAEALRFFTESKNVCIAMSDSS